MVGFCSSRRNHRLTSPTPSPRATGLCDAYLSRCLLLLISELFLPFVPFLVLHPRHHGVCTSCPTGSSAASCAAPPSSSRAPSCGTVTGLPSSSRAAAALSPPSAWFCLPASPCPPGALFPSLSASPFLVPFPFPCPWLFAPRAAFPFLVICSFYLSLAR